MDFESGILRVISRSLGCQGTDPTMVLSPAWYGRHIEATPPTSLCTAQASVTWEFGDNQPRYISSSDIIVGSITSLWLLKASLANEWVTARRLSAFQSTLVAQAPSAGSPWEHATVLSNQLNRRDVVPISVSFTDDPTNDVVVIGMYCGQK